MRISILALSIIQLSYIIEVPKFRGILNLKVAHDTQPQNRSHTRFYQHTNFIWKIGPLIRSKPHKSANLDQNTGFISLPHTQAQPRFYKELQGKFEHAPLPP